MLYIQLYIFFHTHSSNITKKKKNSNKKDEKKKAFKKFIIPSKNRNEILNKVMRERENKCVYILSNSFCTFLLSLKLLCIYITDFFDRLANFSKC